MAKRVVLAYSGGLDTSIAVRWMRENWDVEVIACAVDVGQLKPGESDAIHERARAAGAVEVEVIDARADFAEHFIVPALRANALYEGKYPLVSALSRPVIVEHLVAAARRHRAGAVGHGCTGKGNDQVRFEVSSRILAPDLEVLAPVRVWGLTRADCVELAGKWEIPIEATVEKLYSIDENMWGRAIECGVLENPWAAPPEEPFTLTRNAKDAPTEPRDIIVGFDRGIPVSLDGDPTDLVPLIDELGRAVGSYGWGRIDMVENRRVGIKSREVYECPASLALVLAHQDLEGITLERDV
ncbi:MAG: argininosuccinate synthase, partial [Acidimicrobiia bacterium]